MPKSKDISILDVTIRDGSYAIDYRYTPDQVRRIAEALDGAGIDFIEVSHGCGLGASENLGLTAAATDAQYVRAAKGVARKAKIGVIVSPVPITQRKDIDTVIHDVDFMRFAANSNAPEAVFEHIEYAKKRRRDLITFFQLIRSSRLSKKEIIGSARRIEDMGVDLMYLVDTAGHFMPEDVGDIISGLVSNIKKMKIGFHGHNNLGLAIANTLAAIDAGASSVDGSLKGIGRAGGNAQLEILVSLLHRKGQARGVDLEQLIIAADSFVEPIMPSSRGISSMDVITADANTDIYPLSKFEKIAYEADVNLIDLVYALGGDRAIVEIGPAEMSRVLEKLGCGKPKRVLVSAGLIEEDKKVEPPGVRPAGAKLKLNAVLALNTPNIYRFPKQPEAWLASKYPDVTFSVVDFSDGKIAKIDKADILWAHSISEKILSAASRLKWFHSVMPNAEGLPLAELTKRKIIVTTSRNVHEIAMSEFAVALMFALSRKLHTAASLQSRRLFSVKEILDSQPPLSELMGSTAVIVGLGAVGTAIAAKCRTIGMNVIGVVRSARPKSANVDEQVIFDRLDEVVGLADYLILACPLTKATNKMIDEARLRKMKPISHLINVANGGLVDEISLSNALKRETIGGAACDVFAEEPLPSNHAFYSTPNLIITPHIASMSILFWSRAAACFASNLDLFLKGELISSSSKP